MIHITKTVQNISYICANIKYQTAMAKKKENKNLKSTKPKVWKGVKKKKHESKTKKASKGISIDSIKGVKDLIEFVGGNRTKKNIKKLQRTIEYQEELKQLQVELIKLQQWVQKENKRVAILFEGRDAAGKGGSIRRFIEHLNPRSMRVVALPKPNDVELGQWYFQRYINQLPNPGEMVFFDRSWYNRAVVEPVNGFCSEKDYKQFLLQVPSFENMLYEDGIIVFKFWFSISKKEQLRRFKSRKSNPLKQWKISPVDMKAQKLWDRYTFYKEEMFYKTHSSYSPWIIVKADDKKSARLATVRFVLDNIDYEGKGTKTNVSLHPDPNIVQRFHRQVKQLD